MNERSGNKNFCAVFAGGTTGGHLMPGAATAEALREIVPAARCVFLTSDRDAEEHCRGAVAGFETRQVPHAPAHGLGRKLLYPARALLVADRVMRLYGQLRPDVVVGLGSYNCAVPVLLARCLGIPTAMLEANAVPGRAVRMLAPLVDAVFVNWGEAIPRLDARRAVATGLPLRSRIFTADRDGAARRLGISPDGVTLLVIGGSQGALALNRALYAALKVLRERKVRLQVVHLTGVGHLEEARARPFADRPWYRAIGFLERIEDAYAVADFALSRAGSTVAELCALGVPSVLVPYPHHADAHQVANARILTEAGAAIALPQSKLDGTTLANMLERLATDGNLRRRMSRRALAHGRPDAAYAVAAELASLAGFGRCLKAANSYTENISDTLTKAA